MLDNYRLYSSYRILSKAKILSD